MWQLSQGLLAAQNQAQMQSMDQNPPATAPDPNQGAPTLTTDQNQGSSQPMAAKGGTTSFSSPQGFIDKTRQNLAAQGK
jgi:hypothetical protein